MFLLLMLGDDGGVVWVHPACEVLLCDVCVAVVVHVGLGSLGDICIPVILFDVHQLTSCSRLVMFEFSLS